MSKVHPKSGETPNARRATWARRALDTFTRETFGGRSWRALLAESGVDGDARDACGDLICNVLHLAAGRKMDYAHILRAAVDHFTCEMEQEGRTIAPELGEVLARNPLGNNPAAPVRLSPGAAVTVWTLLYEHRHGSDLSCYASKDDARAALLGIVRDQWEIELPSRPMPDDGEQAIEEYFAVMNERAGASEFFTIECHEIGGAPVLSPGAAAEVLATHNGAADLGAALGVAVGGIAALCSQLESAMNGGDYSPAQACVSVAGQGRALLNRLGRMVGPGSAPADLQDVAAGGEGGAQ